MPPLLDGVLELRVLLLPREQGSRPNADLGSASVGRMATCHSLDQLLAHLRPVGGWAANGALGGCGLLGGEDGVWDAALYKLQGWK